MRFQDIPGHDDIKRHLARLAVGGRLSHAILFTGSAGSGHYSLALALAQYLQCQSPQGEDSCGVCPACHQASGLVHPDIHFVFPVARTAKISGDPVSDNFLPEWRNYLQINPYPSLNDWTSAMGIENKQAGIFAGESESLLKKMSFKPFESDFKVVIFWLPEMMNPAAANKLLKLIEEPADFTVFLFVSEQPDLILPTILSRTQPVKVPGISNEALKAKLAYDFPDAGAELETVTRIARGDYLKARDRLTHREQDVYFREKLIEWLRMAYGLKVLELKSWVDEMADLVREKQKAFLIYAIRTLRGNFMLNRGLDELVAFDPEEQAFSLRFRRFIHEGNIRLLYEELSLAITQISLNANSRILFTDLSLKLHELLKIPAQE